MSQSKSWTRTHKLALIAIVVPAIIAIIGIAIMFIRKINIDISYIKEEIVNMKAKNAEIDSLKSDVAEIKKLYAGDTEVGRFKSTCPEGTSAINRFTPTGFQTLCN